MTSSIAQRLPPAVVNYETARVRDSRGSYLLSDLPSFPTLLPKTRLQLGIVGRSIRRMGEHPVSCPILKNFYRCNECIDNHLKRFKCSGFANWSQLRSLALGSSIWVTGPHLGACHYLSLWLLSTTSDSGILISVLISFLWGRTLNVL